MRRDNRPWRTVPPAALDWGDADDARGPISTAFGDVYYSREDGLRESRYVFLEGNAVEQRLRQHSADTFCIGETGFGTGLNFLLTWQAWRHIDAPKPRLHYLSVEKHPLTTADLQRALSHWPELEEPAAQLVGQYPSLVPGQHRLVFEGRQVILDLWWEDALEALSDLAGRNQPLVDAWYLDGFAPAVNEGMWEASLLQAVAAVSRPGATFATFTAAGQVRRDLSASGFEVRKVPGYGRKRECLRGTLTQTPPPVVCAETPWDQPTVTGPTPKRALVIGGGLAGCTAARALAGRGIEVILLEKNEIAGAGSGNEQGVLYTRLSGKHSPLTDFAIQSYCFAGRYYRSLFETGVLEWGIDGALCGSFHQQDDSDELLAMTEQLRAVPDLASVLDAEAAKRILGVSQHSSGFWFPASGWLRPIAICSTLANTAGVTVMENCGAITLSQHHGNWQARAGNRLLAEAPCAILATGTETPEHPAMQWLPLQKIRGQTTQLPSTVPWKNLEAVLCHDGYIPPARQGSHCIGATFDLRDDEQLERPGDHGRNLAALAEAVPGWTEQLEALDVDRLNGRTGFRCASPDYLPLAGPVPDRDAFLQVYAPLRKNARRVVDALSPCLPGLYVSTGHGSRGLTSTPLAAELLASLICGEPPPLSREISRALSPARFIIRDLGRNRI